MNILVSECLLGIRCKYSGGANPCLAVIQAVKAGRHRLIPVCPECLGGLLNSKTAEGATIYNTAVAYPVGIVFAAAMLALFIHATKKAGVRKAA